jgi:hypothetical protein
MGEQRHSYNARTPTLGSELDRTGPDGGRRSRHLRGAHMATLVAAGKAKKLALTACMRKLLVILDAMLREGTPWHATVSP